LPITYVYDEAGLYVFGHKKENGIQ
jgi:hypothetical protein